MFYDLNLNNLKYFYEIANTKNITKASENLNVSQPALTHAIKELESSLNTKILERSKKGVSLTPSGEILYEYTKNMLHNLGLTINTINDELEFGGNLYIGATTTNFLEPIKDALSKFKDKHPNVHIDIVLEDISVLENRSKLGKLDILIKNDYENMDNIEIIKTFSITDRFIASKKFFNELVGVKLSLEELLTYPFVLLSNITHGRKNFDAYLKSLNISFKPTYEFNSYSLCKELIRNGFGIGIGNPIHYQNKEFIILDTLFSLPTRNFDICYNKLTKNDLINDFITLLK